jgi:hypothetical protein
MPWRFLIDSEFSENECADVITASLELGNFT